MTHGLQLKENGKVMRQADDKRKQTTLVTIFGAEYVLSSEESEVYTREISSLVDQKMRSIANEMNLWDTTKVAIMAAMEIAGQLLEEHHQQLANTERAEKATERLGQYLDRATKDEEAA